MSIDPLTTFQSLLLAQGGVTALVSDRVWRMDAPAQDWQTAQDVEASIVLSLGEYRQQPDAPVVNAQINCLIYGPTAGAAVAVALAIAAAVHGKRRMEAGGVMVGGIMQTAGPNPGRDEDTDWPVCEVSYQATFIE